MAEKENRKSIGERMTDMFLSLPYKAQAMFFEYLENRADDSDNPYTLFSMMGDFGCSECESPIEKIFYFAYQIVLECEEYDSFLYYLLPQYEVSAGKRYRADFVFDTQENVISDSDYHNEFKLIVECDGHEFHEKTKEQVRKGNERDMALKKAGYDVIHYSGSQIYENPIKCAKEVLDYIKQKVGNK